MRLFKLQGRASPGVSLDHVVWVTDIQGSAYICRFLGPALKLVNMQIAGPCPELGAFHQLPLFLTSTYQGLGTMLLGDCPVGLQRAVDRLLRSEPHLYC